MRTVSRCCWHRSSSKSLLQPLRYSRRLAWERFSPRLHGSCSSTGWRAPPDVGVSRALTQLGFSFVEGASDDPSSPPFCELRQAVAASPAIVGPLDIGLLPYRPQSRGASGSDHYILVLEIEGDEALVHDPWGFPFASLTLDQLREAWRADLIPYRRGFYRYWHSPRRVESPTDEELYARTVNAFREAYEVGPNSYAEKATHIGVDAIREVARIARGGELASEELAHLSGFSLRLACRRAIDFALFFRGRNPPLAELKDIQARQLGRAHVDAVKRDISGLAEDLERVADAEDEFRLAL
jgi:hypothetical protein